jgi:ABC-type Fe3+-siderophore transport system permease subunit
MVLPRFSLATIAFMILLLAIDFTIIRIAFQSSGPEIWAALPLLLLPMLDVILITLYRLRRRERRTSRAIGFLVSGVAATVVVFVLCLIAPDTVNTMIRAIDDAIAETTMSGLTWLLGNTEMHQLVMQFAVVGAFAILVPMALFCSPPLMVALLGGWLAPRLGSFHRVASVRER